MSLACDLMTPNEEELLRALTAYIEDRTDAAQANVVSILARYISTAYVLGGEKAGKVLGITTPIALDGLDPVLDQLGPALDETFHSLGGELTSIIRDGISNRSTYADVQKRLADKLKAGWGNSVTFNRVGQTRRYVHVNPDGSMKWVEKTISRPITLPTDTYADTLARSSMKAAYAQGKVERYRQAGKKGWRYTSAADERTRPRHLALHGRTFYFGSEEEQQALEVMKEANCRCQPDVFFDDPDLDVDPGVYEQQRLEWAGKALDEQYLDDGARYVAAIPPGENKSKEEMIGALIGKYDQNDDIQLLHGITGISMREQAVRTFDTLHQNFTHKGVADTVQHIAEAKGNYGIADVLHAKENGTDVGSTGRSRIILGESEMRVPIAVFIKQDGRIGTALKCTKKCQKWIKNRVRGGKA